MRIIPKRTKVKTDVFKGFNAIDLIILIAFVALVGLVLLSNLPGKAIFAIVIAVFAFTSLLSVDDDKLYVFIINSFLHLFKKKLYIKNALKSRQDIKRFMPYTKIIGDTIYFADEYVAQVVEIEPLEFRLLDEYKQDKLIDVLATCLKGMSVNQKMQLVKIDRPLVLDEFILNTKTKIGIIEKAPGYTDRERESRIELLTARLESFEAMNEDKIPISYFYLVCLSSLGSCNAFTKTTTFTLQNAGIECRILDSAAELANFIKYQYSYNFDERAITEKYKDALSIEDLTELFPENVKIKANHIEVDDKKVYQYAINDYPIMVGNAWGYNLFNVPGTRVILNVDYMDKQKAEKMIDNSVMEIELKQKYAGKASKQISNDAHMESLLELMTALKTDNEILLNASLYVSYFEDSIEGLNKQEVKRTIKNDGFKLSDNFFRQSQAFVSSNVSKREEIESYKRGINSSSLAACFPFVSNKVLEPNGVLIGYNGTPVCIDFFKRNQTYKNSNTVIIGSSGSGKSYAIKTLASNLAADNLRVFILDPENEYSALAKNMGGKVIDMASGESKINPLQIMSNMLDEDDNAKKSPLSEHLQFLESFYDAIFPKLTPVAFEILNKLTVELYKKFNIYPYTTPTEIDGISPDKFPTFTDLDKLIKLKLRGISKNKLASTTEGITTTRKMSKSGEDEFIVGSLREVDMYVSKLTKDGRFASLWNAPTNLVADRSFICFNFQGLLASSNNTLAEAQMLLLTRFLNNEIVINFNKYKHLPFGEIPKFLIAIDEAHVFFNSKNTLALDFIKNNSKRVRKYGGMQIVITQSIRDFVATEAIAAAAKSVVTESQYSLIFPLSAGNLDDLLQLYKGLDLNETEQQDIMGNNRGTCFMISSQYNRTNIDIIANEKTRLMFGDSEVKKEIEERARAEETERDQAKEEEEMQENEKEITLEDIKKNPETYYDEDDGANGEADDTFVVDSNGTVRQG